ncbi:MAG: hypothetical protein HWE27_12180 [Gammaproteobacteria bacterium]|nr:hypothetical protein [Gammaproteobacteria bacterium]
MKVVLPLLGSLFFITSCDLFFGNSSSWVLIEEGAIQFDSKGKAFILKEKAKITGNVNKVCLTLGFSKLEELDDWLNSDLAKKISFTVKGFSKEKGYTFGNKNILLMGDAVSEWSNNVCYSGRSSDLDDFNSFDKFKISSNFNVTVYEIYWYSDLT